MKMKVLSNSAQEDTPKMGAWVVDSVYHWSNVVGGVNLCIDDGRFVGLAPEVFGLSH
jgi:hypothetical protein